MFAVINLGCWESFVIVSLLMLWAVAHYGKKLAANEHAQKFALAWLERRLNGGKEKEGKE